MSARCERGYVLVAVMAFLLITGAVSLLLVEESGMNSALTNAQAERDALHYLTQTALEHATWQLHESTSCANYSDLTSTPFGADSYSATITPSDGSPVAIAATGTLASGSNRTANRTAVRAYGVPLTLVLQPGSEGKDGFIEGDPGHQDHNKEDDKDIKVSSESGKEYHGLLQFDLSSIPTGSTIRSAILELYNNNSSSSSDSIGVHRITQEWTESGATWIERRAGDDWGAPGGDFDATQTAAFDAVGTGWRSVDITSLAQEWLNGSYPNYGLLLAAEIAPGNDVNEFTSSDDGDASLHPKLTIVYACECGMTCAGPSFGPIAHWKLDDGSGSTAIDSANGNDGKLSGNPTWEDGVTGGALDFDGSGDRIEAGALLGEGTPEITVAAWVYKRDAGDDRVVAKSASTSRPDHIYSLGVANTTVRVHLKTEDNGGTSDYDGGNITLNQWTHLAFTYDGASLRIYKNGEQTAVHAVTGPVVASSIATVLGNVNDSDDRHWNGLLDDVRIYNRALAPGEVADLGDYLAVSATAHWKLDEGSGDTAVDSVGGHDGKLVNDPVWSSGGMRGGALDFDGLDDYVEVPHDDALSIASELTIAAWIYNASPAISGSYRILSKEPPGANDSFWLSLQGQTLWFGVGGSFYSAPTTVAPNTWYHVAASFDDANNQVRLYVDGVEVGQYFSGASITVNSSALRIGANWESNKYWQGLLDDVRLYDRVLSAADVAALADSLTDTSAAHWPLDDGAGTTAVDVVGAQDGTLNGGPVWSVGQIDGGLEFDGVDDHVDVGSFDVSGSGLTLSGWFNADDLVSEGRIISKAKGVTDDGTWWQLSIRDKNAAQWLRVRIKAGSTTTAFEDTTVPLQTGRWYFAAATYDNASAEMKLYLNGALLGTKAHAVGGALDADPDVPVFIGANNSAERLFDGTLDDIRIYNRALSAAEVSSLAGPAAFGPIAHWPFEETSGNTAEDIAGGHDGAVYGSPLWESGALRFDGSNDYVEVAHDTTLTLLNGMTFAARIYVPSFGSGYRTIVAKDAGGNDSNYWFGTHGRDLEFGFWYGGSFRSVSTSSLNLNSNTWYDVAASYDATTDRGTLYVGGVQVHTGSVGASPNATTADLEIGRSPDGEYWLGYIEDLRIYNQVLRAEQISGIGAGSGSCAGTFADEFPVQSSFAGDTGSLSWATDWIEVNESNGADSGDIMVVSVSQLGSIVLRVRDNDGGGEGARRMLDTSKFTSATLSFDYQRAGTDNVDDYVMVEVSSDNGANWTELDRFAGPGNDDGLQPASYDVSSFISSTMGVRFVSGPLLGRNDQVFFDNVTVTVSGCAD